jgi:hypothetical protein
LAQFTMAHLQLRLLAGLEVPGRTEIPSSPDRLQGAGRSADEPAMTVAETLLPSDYVRLVDAVRLELQDAGNPAFIIAIRDAGGTVHLAPMVFAAVGPAGEYARRVAASAVAEGERVLIVSRQATARRQSYDVLEPGTLRRLHLQQEVIEQSFAETDGPI